MSLVSDDGPVQWQIVEVCGTVDNTNNLNAKRVIIVSCVKIFEGFVGFFIQEILFDGVSMNFRICFP